MRNFVELRLLATCPSESVASLFFLHTAYSTSPPVAQEKLGLFILRGRLLSGQDFMQHNTLSKHNQKLPFTRYDFGWVLLCIGMHGDWCRNRADASTNWLEGNLGIYYRSDHCLSCHRVVQDIYLKPFLKAIPVMTTPILSVITGEELGNFPRGYLLLMIIHGIFISLSPWFSTAPRT